MSDSDSHETCTICTDEKCDVELSCQHSFCRDCLVSYVENEVSNNEYKIICPSNHCTDEIEYDQLKLILVDNENILARLDRNIIRNQEREEFFQNRPESDCESVEIDVDVKRCPYCKYLIHKEEGCDAVKCPNCRYKFCFNCLEMYRFMESVDDHEKKCRDFNGFNDSDSDDPQ